MSTAFEEMSAKERLAIVNERRSVTFTAQRSTLGFETVEETLPGTDATRLFTKPPSPVILASQNIGKACASTAHDWNGRWLRFVFTAYFYEGQIWYRKLDEQTFEVQVKFE
jgi:hypothetical protein